MLYSIIDSRLGLATLQDQFVLWDTVLNQYVPTLNLASFESITTTGLGTFGQLIIGTAPNTAQFAANGY